MKLPNTEALVRWWLLGDAGIKTATGGRVYAGDMSSTSAMPAVRLSRFGGSPAVSRPLVLDEADLQVDVWAASKLAAFDIVADVMHRLSELDGERTPFGSATTDVGALRYVPDDVFDPPRPRYLVDVTVWARPLAA